MKKLLAFSVVILVISTVLPRPVQAQCTYTAVRNGLFSAASTWSVSASTNAVCSATPTSNTDAAIVINGFSISIDVNYIVAKQGSITLKNGASLAGGVNLQLGDGTGSQVDTNLMIEPGSTLRVGQLTVNKGTVTVSAPLNAAATTLTTDCNLVLVNSSITDNSRVLINGSIDLTSGGANNTLCGTGSVRIEGCVFGGNGATHKLATNCASTLVTTVCSQQQQMGGCPGPIAGTNASEQACDALVGSCPAPLPVELVLFTATLTGRQGVALHWITASEKNSQSFVVERSADGKTFRDLRTVAAAGSTTASTTYDLTDEQPPLGTSYYRLRQMDLNGTATYSPVRSVQLCGAHGEGLAVYPGQSAQEWVVSTGLPAQAVAGDAATIQVFDAVGRVQQVSAAADAAQPGRWTLDTHLLPAGVYIVRLRTKTDAYSQRLAK